MTEGPVESFHRPLASLHLFLFLMKDFGFDPPDILGMLKVQDGVTVTVTFTARASA